MDKLIIPTLKPTVVGVILLGLLLFLPAGTLNYWQAWGDRHLCAGLKRYRHLPKRQ